jgi:hypothetical protein
MDELYGMSLKMHPHWRIENSFGSTNQFFHEMEALGYWAIFLSKLVEYYPYLIAG